jgi:hypothetical protein
VAFEVNEGADLAQTLMVKKLELAVSLGFTSKPQRSPPTCVPPLKFSILHTTRNAIIKEEKMIY